MFKMVYAKAVLKCLTTGQFLDRALGIHALLNKDHDSPRVLTGSHRVSLCLLIWGGGGGVGGAWDSHPLALPSQYQTVSGSSELTLTCV